MSSPEEQEKFRRRILEKQDVNMETSSAPRVALETPPITEVYVALPPSLQALVMWGGPTVPRERLDEIKKLHSVCFPVKYSDSFYEKIANGTYPSRILYERLPSGRGRIVGFASSIIYQEPLKGYLATLGVRPEWRKRGVAKVLIRCIETYLFKNYEIEYVELHVLHSNIAAIRLYESLKYTMIEFLEKHYVFEDPETGNNRHDAFLYRKYRDPFRRRPLTDFDTEVERCNKPFDNRTSEEKESSASEVEKAEKKYGTSAKLLSSEDGEFYAGRLE